MKTNLCLIALLASSLLAINTYADVVYDFESETSGASPSSPWIVSGNTTPTVTNTAAYSGNQSIEIAPDVGWNEANYPITLATDEPASYSVMVNPSNGGGTSVALTGVYSPIYVSASVQFQWGINYRGNNSYQYIFIKFNSDQYPKEEILIQEAANDGQAMHWPNEWYQVSIDLTETDVNLSVTGPGVDLSKTYGRTDHSGAPLNGIRLSGQNYSAARQDHFDDFTVTTPPDCAARGSEGDFNCDATIGLLDLDILGTNWGTADLDTNTSYALGDANADGTVGLLDLDTLGNNWGQSTSTPEPTSLALLTIAAATIIRRKQTVNR